MTANTVIKTNDFLKIAFKNFLFEIASIFLLPA